MIVDISKWSGEGAFTQVLLDCLREVETIEYLRVEDAPASRSEADYNFMSNEIFVLFRTGLREKRGRWLGVLPVTRHVPTKAMTVARLEQTLAARPGIGEADYSDEGMLQYLRAERVVPPYQTRGYKLVELVRIYEISSRSSEP